MRKVRFALILLTALATQQVIADTTATTTTTTATTTAPAASPATDKPCMVIANACITAGYVETQSADKNIWLNCMKPVIMGQTVIGVTVDATVIQACKTDKIASMQKELAELQGTPAN